jgi:hypothetical protein
MNAALLMTKMRGGLRCCGCPRESMVRSKSTKILQRKAEGKDL